MPEYVILTDSSCDLPQALADELELGIVPLSVNFRGKEYANYLDGRELDPKVFYKGLRDGELTSTTAANPIKWEAEMRRHLQAGCDVLVLAFSSGLSTTYNAAKIAAEELQPEFPERKIYVVDTLCASLGQGLLCYYAVMEKRKGKSIEQVRDFAEQTKLHLCHWFTVDDLHHLKRGGRVSATTAIVGSLLNIKPVLHVDDEGHLINVDKTRGRKSSLNELVEHMKKTVVNPDGQMVFISHGDCYEEAEYVAQLVKQNFAVQDVVINYVGPVIGSHSGPGTMALFFLGSKR